MRSRPKTSVALKSSTTRNYGGRYKNRTKRREPKSESDRFGAGRRFPYVGVVNFAPVAAARLIDRLESERVVLVVPETGHFVNTTGRIGTGCGTETGEKSIIEIYFGNFKFSRFREMPSFQRYRVDSPTALPTTTNTICPVAYTFFSRLLHASEETN